MRFAPTLKNSLRLRPTRPAASNLAVITGLGALLIGAALMSPIRPAVVVGTSMSPSLEPGQIIWCQRAPRVSSLHRGDVVLAKVDGNVCVKRVFALEGDQFWKTWGFKRDETLPQLIDVGTPIGPWKRRYPNFQFQKVRMPPGTVYLVGDGVNSVDSRRYGPVEATELVGKVIYPSVPRNLSICEPSVWTALPIRPAGRARS